MAENQVFDKDNRDQGPEFITFVVHTAKYRTLPTKKYLMRKPWEPKDPKKICAFVPGIIHKIHVKEGETVKKGETLLEIEAMKMYNRVLAPFDGKIKKIYVEEKMKVPKNFVILEFQ